jgi:hypothetical protein
LPYAQKYNQILGISYQTQTRILTTFNGINILVSHHVNYPALAPENQSGGG